jgi:molybdate transport repressor ModE-like protein
MKIDRLDWNDLQLFLTLAAAGSVRGAARDTGLSINTVRARLEVMEHLSGVELVERSAKGLGITEAGRAVLEAAERMQAARATGPAAAEAVSVDPRVIRLSLPEGLAAHWLMPYIAGWQAGAPDAVIQLRTDQRAADQTLSGLDLAMHLKPGLTPGYDTRAIGALHLMPFASQGYLDRYGTPKHFNEWRTHRLVWQDWEPQAADVMPLFIADDAPSQVISMVTGSTVAQVAAVRAGVGLGFLPTYMANAAPDLQPVDFGMQFRRTIYLSVRGGLASPAADTLAQTLTDAVADPEFFGESFKVPQRLCQTKCTTR